MARKKPEIILSKAFDPSQKKADIEAWKQWKKTRSPNDLEVLLDQTSGIIHSSVVGQRGTLPEVLLELQAKKIAVSAFDTYDPGRGVALSTHLTNSLKQLSRLNMTYKQTARVPEHQQRKVRDFLTAREELSSQHGRSATSQKVSELMKMNIAEVHRLEVATRSELSDMIPTTREESLGFSNVGDTTLDPMVTFIYHDLDPIDKLIFEYTTGFGGKPILGISDISKKTNLSYSQVSYRKRLISDKIKQRLGRA